MECTVRQNDGVTMVGLRNNGDGDPPTTYGYAASFIGGDRDYLYAVIPTPHAKAFVREQLGKDAVNALSEHYVNVHTPISIYRAADGTTYRVFIDQGDLKNGVVIVQKGEVTE